MGGPVGQGGPRASFESGGGGGIGYGCPPQLFRAELCCIDVTYSLVE